MKIITCWFSLCLIILVPILSTSQTDSSRLTIDRIYKDRDFRTKSFGPARWLNDGETYTTVEQSDSSKGSRDIVKYATATGKRSVMVPASHLVPVDDSTRRADSSKPLGISDYNWSTDGQKLLLYTNTARVWRQNTRGDYWVVDLKTWKLHKLGAGFPSSTLMFAKFSPDGNRVAYVQKNNLYLEDIASGEKRQLTTDGSAMIINGTFDWDYEEEWGMRDGFRWSPDGKYIAYWQLDQSGVGLYTLIDDTDSIYSQTKQIPYPKVGTTLSSCRVGVVSVNGGATTWIDVPGNPRDNYIPRMEWAASSAEIALQQMNRRQNTNTLMLGNALTGKVTTLVTDTDSAWVKIVDDLQWFDDGKRFTWVSERDGWEHLFMYDRTGKLQHTITPGNYDVIHILTIDGKNGWVYFIASPDNPTQRYLYRHRLDGTGKLERLSPTGQPGVHSYDVSPDGKFAFHTYSSFGVPPVIDLVRLPSHDVVRVLQDNSEVRSKVQALDHTPVEYSRLDIGNGVQVDVWVMKPPHMDENKKYPLLVHVYGEPATQTVLDSYGGNYLWHLMLTQQGYVVASIDNHGSPAPRGRFWRKSIYRQIGILASADQAAAVRQLVRRPYLDSTRVGVWGWSGGGSMTLNALFRYPDLYSMGMSVAPVPDQRLYDATYQERYMGLLPENESGYHDGSPVSLAKNLKGKLLLVHGSGDDNVHYQGSERLINELIKYNKLFTMFAYPNRTHGISEGENTTRHVYETLMAFLHENLPAGGR